MLQDMIQREAHALEILGSYSVKTAGGLMNSVNRNVNDGWIYANSTDLMFISDTVIPWGGPELLDARTLRLPIAGRRYQLTAPMLVPNGIIDFGGGLEFVGQKKHIKALAALI